MNATRKSGTLIGNMAYNGRVFLILLSLSLEAEESGLNVL